MCRPNDKMQTAPEDAQSAQPSLVRPRTLSTRRSGQRLPTRQNSARSSGSTPQMYAGFHGSDDTKIAALIAALDALWRSPTGMPGSFIDLGCGDGRVVLEVARAFPSRECIGVDCQAMLVDKAKAMAKQQRTSNAAFHAGDLAAVDLSHVSVVFLYFPPMALPALLAVLCASNLRNGATVVSADGAWKSRESHNGGRVHRHATWEHSQSELLGLLQPWRHCWGTADLYFYTWRGNATRTPEASAADEARAQSADAAVKAARARVNAYVQAERDKESARSKALEDLMLVAAARAAVLAATPVAPYVSSTPRLGSARVRGGLRPWTPKPRPRLQVQASRCARDTLWQCSPYAVPQTLPAPKTYLANGTQYLLMGPRLERTRPTSAATRVN